MIARRYGGQGDKQPERRILCGWLAQQWFTDDEIVWITGLSRATVQAYVKKFRSEGYEIPYEISRRRKAQGGAILIDQSYRVAHGRSDSEEEKEYDAFRPPAGMATRLNARLRSGCSAGGLVKGDQS